MGLVERLDFQPHSKQDAQPKQAKDKKGHKKWAEIDRYIVDVLVPSDPALDAALHTSQAAELPPINVSPNQGKLQWCWHKPSALVPSLRLVHFVATAPSGLLAP